MMCEKCNIEMVPGRMEGQHPFELGADGRSNIRVQIPTGEKAELLGMRLDKTKTYGVQAFICPNCRKIELYAIDKLK